MSAVLSEDVLLRRLRARDESINEVKALRAVTSGASQEIWSFVVCRDNAQEPLVLRRARQWNQDGQALTVSMATEAAVLRAAAAHGVPVPRVFTELDAADDLGEGYIMAYVAGETAGRRILRDPVLSTQRPQLLRECADILARLHAVPSVSLPHLQPRQADEELAHWSRVYRTNGVARPVFEVAMRWLIEHMPAPVPATLVHGDFRNGNLVINTDGVRAVLDWELTHLGDPMEDLGMFCCNAWRFGAVERPAGGFGSRAELFEAYEAAGGGTIDVARVHYWEVLCNFKWGVVCDAMGLAWRSGQDRTIERLAIGRRTTEVEVDLLQLLAPRGDA